MKFFTKKFLFITALTMYSAQSYAYNVNSPMQVLDPASLMENVLYDTNASSSLIVRSGSIVGNVTMQTAGQYLTLDGNDITLTGTINGPGNLNLSGSHDAGGDIGNLSALSSIMITSGALYLSATNLTANTIYLDGGGGFGAGTGNIAANIQGISDGVGTVYIGLGTSSPANTTFVGNIGAVGFKVDSLEIRAATNVDLGNHSVRVNQMNITGSLTLSGALEGEIYGGGALNIASGATIQSNGGIGQLAAFGTLNVLSNATFNLATNNNNFAATAVNLSSGATLSVGSASFVSTVDGYLANAGTVNLTATRTLGTDFILGSSNGLSDVNISDGVTITANGAIKSSRTRLGTSSTLSIGSASFVSTLDGNTANTGTVNLTTTRTVDTDFILGSTNGLSAVNIAIGVAIAANSSIKASTISLDDFSSLSLAASQSVTGNVSLDTGSTLALSDGSSVSGTINGSAANRGTVTTDGNITLNNTVGQSGALSEFNISVGTTNSAYNIAANDIVVSGILNLQAAVTLGGDVAVLSGGKINLGTQAQNVSGSFNAGSGSAITIAINNSTSASSLTAVGIANISANTTLHVNLGANHTNGGASYTIISGGTGSTINKIEDINIKLDGGTTNKAGNLTFTTEVVGDSLMLKVAGVDENPAFATNSNQSTVYNAIANVADASGELAVLQNYLNSNDVSDAQKTAALKSALPEVDNAVNRVSFNNSNVIAGLVSKRVDLVRSSTFEGSPAPVYRLISPPIDKSKRYNFRGLASGDELTSKNVWVQTFGSNAKQNNTAQSEGYNANSSGITFGADKKISKDTLVGVALGYSSSNVKSSTGLQHNKIDSYQFNIYSGHNYEKYFINNVIGAALNQYSAQRSILGANATAKADYSGQNYFARSEIGTRKQLQNGLIVTPTLMITAAHNTVSKYTEEGAGTLDLTVQNSGANFLEGRAGIALSKAYLFNDKKLLPEISISYGYDFIGDKQKATSQFVGQTTSFATQSSKLAQGSLKLGTGVQFFQADSTTLSLDYSFESRANYKSHYGALRFKYAF